MKNKFLNYMIVIFLLMSQLIATKSLQSEIQGCATQQIVRDRILSESEIRQFLENKFATIKVASDVNIFVIARSIYKEGDITQVQLENMVAAIQKLALQDGADVISRKHISFVLYKKNDSMTFLLIFLMYNKRSVALHEAGHAVAIVHLLSNFWVLNEVCLGGYSSALGFVNCLPRGKNDALNSISLLKFYKIRPLVVDIIKKYIMMCFCGGIAEQMFRSSKYTQLYDWINYQDWFKESKVSIDFGLQALLSDEGCSGDIKEIHRLTQSLIDKKLTHQTKDEIFQECYDQAYQFILKHVDDVKTLSDALIKNNTLFGEHVYKLLGVERSLFDFEEIIVPAQKKKWSWRWKR